MAEFNHLEHSRVTSSLTRIFLMILDSIIYQIVADSPLILI